MIPSKMLFLIHTNIEGDTERVLINLLRSLPQSMFDIELISIFKGDLPSDLNHIKYRWIFKRVFRGNVHLFKLFTPRFLFRKLVGNPNDYDIIVSFLHSPTMRIAAGAKGGSAKLVNWIHNEFETDGQLSRLFRNKKEFDEAMQSYDRTIFVAESARQSTITLLPYLADKSQTIYNTIETDVIRNRANEPVGDTKLFKPDVLNIISVGRFAKVKAFDRLLRITRRIADAGIKVHLHLLGKGTLEADYRKIISSLGIESMVSIHGFVENPYKYVAAADLFVCSSLHEGFSTAVTESLIVGTPVVTTFCSGMEELLGSNGEYGIITPNDEEALTAAVMDLVCDREKLKLYAKQAYFRGTLFDRDKTVAAVIDLFNTLLNK